MPNWDYGWNGMYYVTICTGGRECYFGDIINGELKLSEIGSIADKLWLEIPNHFHFVKLDKYVIMPNHVHGIVVINKTNDECRSEKASIVETSIVETSIVETSIVETLHATSPQPLIPQPLIPPPLTSPPSILPPTKSSNMKNKKMSLISPKPGSLSAIIRSYKSAVTNQARQIDADFTWQSRFYDNIIRNDESLNRIRNYIKENPKNWVGDRRNLVNNNMEKNE
jgi:REP element-mobilizing transposase RayT